MKKLTRKQQAFVRHLIENPKESATKAAQATYNASTYWSAAAIAKENLQKPQIMAVLANHDINAQKVLAEGLQAKRNVYRYNGETKGYELVGVEPDHQSRLKAADSILDRLHGKATQRQEVQSTSVSVNINLAGDTIYSVGDEDKPNTN